MTDHELEELLSIIKDIPKGKKKDRQTQLILQAAAESVSKATLHNLTSSGIIKKESSNTQDWILTDKEFINMPNDVRKKFRTMGITAHILARPSGREKTNYIIRYRANGYDVYASSNDLALAKKKFIVALMEADYKNAADMETALESYKLATRRKKKSEEDYISGIPTNFEKFTEYYLDNFHARKVSKETLRIARSQTKNYLLPTFGKMRIKQITPKMCQELLDGLEQDGKLKTCDDIHSLLNTLFKAAVKHAIIEHNPMDMVFHRKHERQHGSALTKEEEMLLLSSTAGTPQQLMFAVALYTGMRPNEFYTAKIDGNFIVANNSKRKGGKIESKKIPISPMLQPYLTGVDKLEFSSLLILRDRFNKLFPNRRLYDLRTTFYTRCQECGVAPVARDEFVGHSLGELGNTYTDLSDDFLLREGKKLVY